MKNYFTTLAFACFVILSFSSCKSSPFEDNKIFTPIVTQGSWEVNNFMDANNNKISGFEGYSFEFDIAGSIKALKNGVEITGSWIENASKNILIVFDNTDPVLNRLTKDWLIKGFTYSSVNLSSKDPLITEKFILQQK